MVDHKVQALIEHNYVYKAAGRSWPVGDVTVLVFPDGTRGLSYSEIRRLNGIVARKLKQQARRNEQEESFLVDWEYENAT